MLLIPTCDLWSFYFNIHQNIWCGGKDFEHYMSTDGYSVNALYSMTKVVHIAESDRAKQQQAAFWFQNNDCVVAIDPGRSPILIGVVHSDEAMADLTKANNRTRHEVIKWSAKHFYKDCGHTYRKNQMMNWIGKNLLVQQWQHSMPTSKTARLDLFVTHVIHQLNYLNSTFSFINAQRVKRLEFKTYIKKQKAYAKLVSAIKGKAKNTVVAHCIWR